MFSLFGAIFLIPGVICLVSCARKRKIAQQLFDQGRYVWGQISDCVPNYNVRINGRCPYIAIVRYVDSMGITHIFRSPSINRFLDPSMIGRQVKVYVSDDHFKHYYVDLDPLLPSYIEH